MVVEKLAVLGRKKEIKKIKNNKNSEEVREREREGRQRERGRGREREGQTRQRKVLKFLSSTPYPPHLLASTSLTKQAAGVAHVTFYFIFRRVGVENKI